MFTIAPPPAVATMRGAAIRDSAKAVATLKRNEFTKSCVEVFSTGPGAVPPALFTTMSRRPNSRIAASTSASSCSSRITSVGSASARPPAARMCAATASICSRVRAPITTLAPASA